jgi:hypothetical protein
MLSEECLALPAGTSVGVITGEAAPSNPVTTSSPAILADYQILPRHDAQVLRTSTAHRHDHGLRELQV